jgi:hypothetical protein
MILSSLLASIHFFIFGESFVAGQIVCDFSVHHARDRKSHWQFQIFLHACFSLSVYDFNVIFNNISVISQRSVLLVEETGLPGENHRPAASYWQLYHIMLYRAQLAWAGFEPSTFLEKRLHLPVTNNTSILVMITMGIFIQINLTITYVFFWTNTLYLIYIYTNFTTTKCRITNYCRCPGNTEEITTLNIYVFGHISIWWMGEER